MKKFTLIIFTILLSVFTTEAQRSKAAAFLLGKGVQAATNFKLPKVSVGPIISPKPHIPPIPKPKPIAIDATKLHIVGKGSILGTDLVSNFQYQSEKRLTSFGGRKGDISKLMSNLYLARQNNDADFANSCIYYICSDPLKTDEIISYISSGNPITSQDAEMLISQLAKWAYRCAVHYPDYNYIDKEKQSEFLAICDKYNMELAPLAHLTFPNGESIYSTQIKEVIDINNTETPVYDSDIIETLYLQYADALYDEGKYKVFLDFFTTDELKPFAQDNINLLLRLFNSAINSDVDPADYNWIIKRAREIDPDRTDQYCEELNTLIVNGLCDTPENVDAIVEFINTQYDEAKTGYAYLIVSRLLENAGKLINESDMERFNCEWETISDYPDSLRVHVDAIAAVGNNIRQICNPDSAIDGDVLYITANIRLLYDQYYSEASEDIDAVVNANKRLPVEEQYIAPTDLIMTQAYAVGHGLDNPKEVIKILEQDSSLFETEFVGLEGRYDYLNYLYSAYDKLGKRKQAKKIKREMDSMTFD